MDTDPPEDSEPSVSDREIRKLETIHRVAAETINRQVDRFHVLEQKVWRHSALLGVILGAFAISAPRALQTLRNGTGVASCLFGASYFGTLVISGAGLLCFIMAMQYEVLRTDPIKRDEDFVDRHGEKSYARSLVDLARSAEEGFKDNRPAFDRKEFWSRWGWRSLPLALVLAAVALATFAFMQL